MSNLCKNGGKFTENRLGMTLWLVVAARFFTSTVMAQEFSPPNPHLAPVPNPVSYQVIIVNKTPPLLRILTNEQAKDPLYVKNAEQFDQFYARPVKLSVFRLASRSMIRTEYENKDIEEFWALDHILIYHPRTFAPGFAMVEPDTYPQMPNYQTTYFSECFWAQSIAPDSEQSRDGIACYLYTRKGPAGVEKLWIDKHTSLPVGWENDNVVYSYKFDSSPEPIPPLPAEYEKLYRRVLAGSNVSQTKN